MLNITLYRGGLLTPNEIQEYYRKGTIIHFRTYLSASMKEEVIENFFGGNHNNNKVIFRLNIDNNEETNRLTKKLSPFSKFPTEEEVIISAGTTF